MKKFRGTKYASVGTSYTPLLDAEIDRVETLILKTQRSEQLKSYCEKAVVWELFDGEWKVRHSWKRA